MWSTVNNFNFTDLAQQLSLDNLQGGVDTAPASGGSKSVVSTTDSSSSGSNYGIDGSFGFLSSTISSIAVVSTSSTPSSNSSSNASTNANDSHDSSKCQTAPSEVSHTHNDEQLLAEVAQMKELLRLSVTECDALKEIVKNLSGCKSDSVALSTDSHAQINALEAELVTKIDALDELTAKYQHMIEAVEAKDREKAKIEARLKEITDKLKDVVKRYAEAKAKIHTLTTSLEQANADIATAAAASATASGADTELLSMRLKIENLERVIVVEKERSVEATSTIQDMKRKLARSITTVEEDALTIQDNQREVQLYRSQLDTMQQQRDEIAEQFKLYKEEAAAATDALVQASTSSSSAYSSEIKALQMKLEQYSTENQLLSDQVSKLGEQQASSHDYKKKAQGAVKKANAATALLADEINQMKQQLLDAEAHLQASQTQQLDLQRRFDVSVALNKDGSEKILQLQTEVSRLNDIVDRMANSSASGSSSSSSSSTCSGTENRVSVSVTDSNSSSSDNTTADVSDSDNCSNDSGADAGNASTAIDTTTHRVHADTKTEQVVEEAGICTTHSSSDGSVDTSISSSSSSSSSSDHATCSRGGYQQQSQLVYVNELLAQLENLRTQSALRGREGDQLRILTCTLKQENAELTVRVEELVAYLDRTKKLSQNDPNAHINMEYLKNCVYRYLVSTSTSEKKRLAPVISAILNFTSAEKAAIDDCIQSMPDSDVNIVSALSSFFT